MDVKNFVLSYYKNSEQDFHVHKVENPLEAQKPHSHNYFQIYYVARGTLTHFFKNESSVLSHGDMFIIPPENIHYIKPDKDALFYSFSFMEAFLNKNKGITVDFLNILKNSEHNQVPVKISINSKEAFYIEEIMEHILTEFNEKEIGFDETIRSYTIILLTMLARTFLNNKMSLPNHFDNNKQFVIHCIEYIENNFTDNISLDKMCKLSAMSKGNFCSLFYKLTGYSLNRYLNLCRIKKATEYINEGYKISAVYALCGYNDFSTFYRNFKKIMGTSPQKYKNTII